jgi:hypothetical protein
LFVFHFQRFLWGKWAGSMTYFLVPIRAHQLTWVSLSWLGLDRVVVFKVIWLALPSDRSRSPTEAFS